MPGHGKAFAEARAYREVVEMGTATEVEKSVENGSAITYRAARDQAAAGQLSQPTDEQAAAAGDLPAQRAWEEASVHAQAVRRTQVLDIDAKQDRSLSPRLGTVVTTRFCHGFSLAVGNRSRAGQ